MKLELSTTEPLETSDRLEKNRIGQQETCTMSTTPGHTSIATYEKFRQHGQEVLMDPPYSCKKLIELKVTENLLL